MIECFKCGATNEKTLLFDAISKKGIVKICNKCLSEEKIPLIKKKEDFESKREEKQTVYERLAKTAGINPCKSAPGKADFRQDNELRKIVEENFLKKVEKEKEPKPHLISNFHWAIMVARRKRKITQQQMARDIAEAEKVIELAEKGILPKDDALLINKIENYLGIKLLKKNSLKEEPKKDIRFDPVTTKILTISDLKKMEMEKEKKSEEKSFKEYGFNEHEDISLEERFKIKEEEMFREEENNHNVYK